MGEITRLQNRLRERSLELPVRLRDLLVNARSLSGKPDDAPDKDLRAFIYREMFSFLAFDNGIGDGSSLIYPKEIVDAIRKLYPGDVKNYTPRSRKRKSFYEVSLEELVEVYREADLRDGLQHSQDGTCPPVEKKPKN